jgi:serine/threonine protein kinase
MEIINDVQVDSPTGNSGDETVLPDAGEPTVFPDSDAGEETTFPPPGDGNARTDSASKRVFAIGDLFLAGRYRIDAAIEGGMEAAAYRGTRLEDGIPVFVKRQWRQKSKHRASILDKLLGCNHAGCVRLLDFDVAERPIEVYEWVDGVPLARMLRSDVAFSTAQIGEIVRALGEALHYLHVTAGTAHRDLKPANIIVTDPARPTLKIADYGVMTLFAAGGATMFAGTKKYAPPEALRWTFPRDSLIAYDWWSLGRIVQELVDGIHPYDRIAALFPDLSTDGEAQEAIWGEILSEEKRSTYGRAGQVEQSAASWRPLLRGLLTTDREKRWGYEETIRWLRGEPVPDSYDKHSSTTDFSSAGNDVLAEILRLSSPENWGEACRLVAESDGVIGYIRRKSDNKRAQTRLREADITYDALVEAGVGDVAEEIFATLALRAVGGDAAPLTLRGYELQPELLLAWASEGASRIDRLIHAFMRDDVIRVLGTLDSTAGTRFTEFSQQYRAVLHTLQRWNAKKAFLDQTAAIALCARQSRAENESQIENARKFLASSAMAPLQKAFTDPQRSDAEAAALVFTFERAADFQYQTVATVERREQEKREAAEDERRRQRQQREAKEQLKRAEERRRDEEARVTAKRLMIARVKNVAAISVASGICLLVAQRGISGVSSLMNATVIPTRLNNSIPAGGLQYETTSGIVTTYRGCAVGIQNVQIYNDYTTPVHFDLAIQAIDSDAVTYLPSATSLGRKHLASGETATYSANVGTCKARVASWVQNTRFTADDTGPIAVR